MLFNMTRGQLVLKSFLYLLFYSEKILFQNDFFPLYYV